MVAEAHSWADCPRRKGLVAGLGQGQNRADVLLTHFVCLFSAFVLFDFAVRAQSMTEAQFVQFLNTSAVMSLKVNGRKRTDMSLDPSSHLPWAWNWIWDLEFVGALRTFRTCSASTWCIASNKRHSRSWQDVQSDRSPSVQVLHRISLTPPPSFLRFTSLPVRLLTSRCCTATKSCRASPCPASRSPQLPKQSHRQLSQKMCAPVTPARGCCLTQCTTEI